MLRITMKSRFFQLPGLWLLLVVLLRADETMPPGPPPRSPEQIEQLLGPIALYPDVLIALILPAATVPTDIVQAARYLNDNGDPAQTDGQPWDDSVRALAHYPDIVKWMDQNLVWTQQVGETFRDQPTEVMNSIQHLRAEARAAGTLVDTPQQRVIVEDGYISIVPAQPDVIYVPYYDPGVVYVSRGGFYSEPFLTFGIGYSTGFWLGYELDWGHRRIWAIDPHERDHLLARTSRLADSGLSGSPGLCLRPEPPSLETAANRVAAVARHGQPPPAGNHPARAISACAAASARLALECAGADAGQPQCPAVA